MFISGKIFLDWLVSFEKADVLKLIGGIDKNFEIFDDTYFFLFVVDHLS